MPITKCWFGNYSRRSAAMPPLKSYFPVIVVPAAGPDWAICSLLPQFSAALNTDVTTGPAEDDRKRHWGIGLLTARSAAKARRGRYSQNSCHSQEHFYSCRQLRPTLPEIKRGGPYLYSGSQAVAHSQRSSEMSMDRVRCVSDFRPIPALPARLKPSNWLGSSNLSPPRMARSKIRGSGRGRRVRRPVQRVARKPLKES